MKVTVCDICGKPIYRHTLHTYTLRKRIWETETFGKK